MDLGRAQYLALVADGRARTQIQLRGGMDAACCANGDLTDGCFDVQCAWRDQGGSAELKVPLRGGQLQAAVCSGSITAAVERGSFVPHSQTAHGHIQTCTGADLATVDVGMVFDLPGLVAAGKALGLGRSRVGQRLGADLQILPRMEGAFAQMHLTGCGTEIQVLAGAQAGPLAVNGIRAAGCAGDGGVPRCTDVGLQLDLACRGQCEVAAGRSHIPQHAHAHTLLGRNDVDLVGIGPAQNGGVNGICHGRSTGGGERIGHAGGIAEFVIAHHQLEVVGVDLTVQYHRARHDIQDIDAVAIQATAIDQNIALVGSETGNTAIRRNIRRTCGQHGPVGIDEPAAAAGNPPGIGHNHIRTRPRHLHIALKRGTILHHHFIQDDLGRGIEVHVPLDLPRQIGLYRRGERIVVQHQPLGIHIELVVLVVGKTIGIGGGNIHHRHPIEPRISLRIP